MNFQNASGRSVGRHEFELNSIYYSVFSVKIASMDAVFEVVAHEQSEIWTGLSHSFTNDSSLQRPSLYRVCAASA